MTALATSNCPHIGQAMPTLLIVVAIRSAMAPQIGQSMSCLPLVKIENNARQMAVSVLLPEQRVMRPGEFIPNVIHSNKVDLATHLSFS
jgi:hypothetical protein